METVSVLDPGTHPEIAEMNDIAAWQDLQAGAVLPTGTQDGFNGCVPYTAVSDMGGKQNTLRTVVITRALFYEVFDCSTGDAS